MTPLHVIWSCWQKYTLLHFMFIRRRENSVFSLEKQYIFMYKYSFKSQCKHCRCHILCARGIYPASARSAVWIYLLPFAWIWNPYASGNWLSVSWTLRIKSQWNFNRNTNNSFQGNAFKMLSTKCQPFWPSLNVLTLDLMKGVGV